ncbi:MAG: hypothetical protein K2L60_00500, partial [Bacteroides sp.]|nr:hypothetical protein [Bacteroides sp.]
IILHSSCLSLFNGLTFSPGHLFSKGLFAMLLDVADAGRAVGLEQEGESLSYPVREHFAFSNIFS